MTRAYIYSHAGTARHQERLVDTGAGAMPRRGSPLTHTAAVIAAALALAALTAQCAAQPAELPGWHPARHPVDPAPPGVSKHGTQHPRLEASPALAAVEAAEAVAAEAATAATAAAEDSPGVPSAQVTNQESMEVTRMSEGRSEPVASRSKTTSAPAAAEATKAAEAKAEESLDVPPAADSAAEAARQAAVANAPIGWADNELYRLGSFRDDTTQKINTFVDEIHAAKAGGLFHAERKAFTLPRDVRLQPDEPGLGPWGRQGLADIVRHIIRAGCRITSEARIRKRVLMTWRKLSLAYMGCRFVSHTKRVFSLRWMTLVRNMC